MESFTQLWAAFPGNLTLGRRGPCSTPGASTSLTPVRGLGLDQDLGPQWCQGLSSLSMSRYLMLYFVLY